MMPSLSAVGPAIRSILTAPGTDLETISAKRVRKELPIVASELGVTHDWVKANKDEIDQLITEVFQKVKSGAPLDDGDTRGNGDGEAAVKRTAVKTEGTGTVKSQTPQGSLKRKFAETEGPPASSPAIPLAFRPIKPSSTQERMDEQLARQLSASINARSTRGSSAAPNGSGTGSVKGKKVRKSKAEVVDSDGEGDVGEGENGEAGRPKKKRKGGGGFQKPLLLSPALQELTGEEQLSRPAVVKALWDHIKANQLQNPANKREILCDDRMKAVFGVNKLDMFKMNKELGKYLHPIETDG